MPSVIAVRSFATVKSKLVFSSGVTINLPAVYSQFAIHLKYNGYSINNS